MFKSRYPIIHEKLHLLLNYMIMLFAFVMPINPMPVKKLVSLMLIVWIFTVDYKKLLELLLHHRAFQALTAFILFATLSLLWSDDYAAGVGYLRFYYKYFFIVVLIIATALDKKYIQTVISIFLTAMLLNEVMSYVIFFELTDNFFGYAVHGNSYNPIPYQQNHIIYSLLIAFTILLLLYKLAYTPHNYLKPIFLFFSITMTANLFLSSGRTGQVALLFIASLMILIYQHRYWKRIVAMLAALALTFVLAYHFSETFNSRVHRGITDISQVLLEQNYNSSFGARIFSYKVVPDILAESSYLFGAGVGDIGAMVQKYYILNGWPENRINIVSTVGTLHNTFLTLLASLGLIGFGLFCYVLYSFFRLELHDHYLSYIRYTLLLALIVSSISSEFFVLRGLVYFFAFFLAILVLQSVYEREETETFRSEQTVS